MPHAESGSPSPLFYSFDLAGKLASWLGPLFMPLPSADSPSWAVATLKQRFMLPACA